MGFKPETIMYWSRVLLGVILGILHAFFWRPPLSIISSFSIALLVYIITYRVFKMVYGRVLNDKSAAWKEGFGSFFLSWLFTWFLLYNIFFTSG